MANALPSFQRYSANGRFYYRTQPGDLQPHLSRDQQDLVQNLHHNGDVEVRRDKIYFTKPPPYDRRIIQGLIIQCYGTVIPSPAPGQPDLRCPYCQRNNGAFVECVFIPGEFQGMCGNCRRQDARHQCWVPNAGGGSGALALPLQSGQAALSALPALPSADDDGAVPVPAGLPFADDGAFIIPAFGVEVPPPNSDDQNAQRPTNSAFPATTPGPGRGNFDGGGYYHFEYPDPMECALVPIARKEDME